MTMHPSLNILPLARVSTWRWLPILHLLLFTALFCAPMLGFAAQAPEGAGGSEFDTLYEMLTGWMTGTLGKIIAVVFIIIGVAAGAARGSIMGFVVGVAAGVGMLMAPGIIDSVFTATLSTVTRI